MMNARTFSIKRMRAEHTVMSLLQHLPSGILNLVLPDGSRHQFGSQQHTCAAMVIQDKAVFDRVLKAGDIGLAESYIDGHWHTPDLPSLLRLMIANREHLDAMVYGSWWGAAWYRIKHWFNRNSKTGSKKNIHAHYDLGNDFYRLWLDPSMSYSSAWFEGQLNGDLSRAQNAKITRALKQAGVTAGSHVLEIGCGWGGLAQLAAGQFKAFVKGVTLSKEQLVWAQQRVHTAGLDERVQLVFQDYRELSAQHATTPFDAIVSIEMFEAVGQSYWPDYFAMLKQCLKPGAKACIQTITIRDDLFDRYVQSTDFIQQYIFPGGLLPSAKVFQKLAQEAGLQVIDTFRFGKDYAETLRRWRIQFLHHQEQVSKLGFDPRFNRTWEFYLAYCEAAFDEGNTDVVQFTLSHV